MERLKHGAANACGAFATLGRLHALRNLGARDVVDREVAARDFVGCIDMASEIEDFTSRYYHARRYSVSWPLAMRRDCDSIVVNGEIDLSTLTTITAQVAASTMGILESVRTIAERSLLARPLLLLLQRAELALPPNTGEGTHYSDLSFECRDRPAKVLRGPTSVHLGPHFKPTYSVADRQPPQFGESIEENIPYFWVMATREALASQMCALSAVEYDGLPLAFYSDMAKQCWDEARHSVSFVLLARKITADRDDVQPNKMECDGTEFESENGGFPIPAEGNFYEAMLNADLVQRLVLMNQRTEAPAIPAITKRLTSYFCRDHESVAEFYEFDRVDETSHAAIGNRWLRHLIPDESERNSAAEEADLLRGVLMLTAFAHHGGGSVAELAERFSS